MPYGFNNYAEAYTTYLDDLFDRKFGVLVYTPFVQVPGRQLWICKVDSYNDRVVKVTFSDGTFTKAVCSKNDKFDLDVGINVCILKRIIGTHAETANSEYSKLFRDIHKMMANQEKDKQREQEAKKVAREKQRKAEMKNKAKKMKEKEEQIDIARQGYVRALRELGLGDDGK